MQTNLDLTSSDTKPLDRVATADLGPDSKDLIGWESLGQLWEGQPADGRLHIFVVPPDSHKPFCMNVEVSDIKIIKE